jgi:hypothetical protein
VNGSALDADNFGGLNEATGNTEVKSIIGFYRLPTIIHGCTLASAFQTKERLIYWPTHGA